MKQQNFLLIFSFILHSIANGMELGKLKSNEEIVFEKLEHLLDFSSKVNLGKTSKSHYDTIKPATPLSIKDCRNLNLSDYTYAMIYYANENDHERIRFLIRNTNEDNKNDTLVILNWANCSRPFDTFHAIETYSKNHNKFSTNYLNTLFAAVRSNCLPSLRLYLKLGSINLLNMCRHDTQESLLHCCASSRNNIHINLMDYLLSFNEIDVNIQDANGKTPIHYISTDKNYTMLIDRLNLLLSHPKILINTEDDTGNTALDYAIEANNEEITTSLIKNGAIQKPFLHKHRMKIYSLVGIIGATIFAYFHYYSTSQSKQVI